MADDRPSRATHEASTDAASHCAYRRLVRALVDDPRPCSRERMRRILAGVSRTWMELRRDVEATRERRRLAAAAAGIPDLEVRCAIADEGRRLLHEAAERARAEAAQRVERAEHALGSLQSRLERARDAQRELKRRLPQHLVEEWEQAEARYVRARDEHDAARRAGRNLEYFEAALQDALAAWQRAHAAALAW